MNWESALSERARREPATEITAFMKMTLDRPELISLAAGFVDQASLPRQEAAEAARAILDDRERGLAALQYGTTLGHAPLREELARRLGEGGLAGSIGPDDVLIAAGSQQLLYLVADAMLDPGDVALVEAPTYFVFASVLQGAAARAVGVATDEEGIVPEALEARLDEFERRGESARVKLLYVMTYYSNPRGTSYSARRMREIHEIVGRRSREGRPILIVEDAAYRELGFEGDEPPYLKSLDRENDGVALVGSFSKAFSPGLRVGYGVAPAWLMARLLCQKTYFDFGSPNFSQTLVCEAMRNGSFDRHVEALKRRYRAKRDLALRVIAETWPKEAKVASPRGGLYLWVRLPETVSTDLGEALFETAVERRNVLYIPGSLCYVGPPAEKPHNEMRLCYGMIEDDEMVEGLKRLGQAIETEMKKGAG